jgi:hypothetical protein
MYEKVDFDKLIKGERYFIRYGAFKWITGKFYQYEQTDGDGIHAMFKNMKKNSSWMYKGMNWRMYSDDLYYKHIPNKVYMQKIKDKYDEKVLKIVLKKIVNEDFEWN